MAKRFSEVAAETELETQETAASVSALKEIQGAGERMGALVTLRDLDSIESINTHFQVSERLAAVGAHHGRRCARSEKSAELNAPVAGKFERKLAAGE